jgi:hypothetical protein
MALNATTLARPKLTDEIRITLTEPACIAPRMFALVDAEWMLIASNLLIPTVGVVPGYNATTAGPHSANAPVIFGIPYDFVNVGIVPWGIVTSQSFGAAGAVTGPWGAGTVPVANSLIYLTSPAAAAFTLAAPGKDQQNTLTFATTTPAASTLVFPALGTGGAIANKTATFPAGASGIITLKAQGGAWVPAGTAGAGGVTVA